MNKKVVILVVITLVVLSVVMASGCITANPEKALVCSKLKDKFGCTSYKISASSCVLTCCSPTGDNKYSICEIREFKIHSTKS
jgi:hypothetical protein